MIISTRKSGAAAAVNKAAITVHFNNTLRVHVEKIAMYTDKLNF